MFPLNNSTDTRDTSAFLNQRRYAATKVAAFLEQIMMKQPCVNPYRHNTYFSGFARKDILVSNPPGSQAGLAPWFRRSLLTSYAKPGIRTCSLSSGSKFATMLIRDCRKINIEAQGLAT